jgi:hypothetical protein
VLHAAFWSPSSMSMYPERLPDKFRYAGLISGAGALMDVELINQNNLIPVMMFHGTCDALVPYAIAAHHFCPKGSPGWMMLYGSHSIYQHIISLNGSCYLVTFCNGSHEFHNKLFVSDQQKVFDFMQQILNGKKIQEHQIIQTPGKCKKASEFKFCD